ncbi:uncharacterized protein L203_103608 [Cryptococcus depauperatus CBS 7841]|uniref:Dynactin subunit 5 n=1 Tax=Cryptococcus depauperatus CBS 7841 TaxID=1295531 RepID=A0AAJ8JU78_9TREE
MGAFDPIITYDKAAYIETETGNKVSRKALITGATNIVVAGKSIICASSILRGDLRRSTAGQHVVISMGRYCVIGEGAVVRPPGKIYKGTFTFYPGKFVVIKDLAVIEPGTVLPEGTVVSSLSVWAGNPGHMVGDLPETHQEMMENKCKAHYQRFRPA